MTLVFARAVALGTALLVVAAVLWRALGAPPPAWVHLGGAEPWLLGLGALTLGLATTPAIAPARRCAMALAALGGLAAGGWLAAWAMADEPAGALARVLALRPAAPVALGIAAFGASFSWRHDADERWDVSMLLGVAAVALFFLAAVGHLYGAAALIDGAAGALGAALWLALALAALALHHNGPLAAYAGSEPGAVARRRLLPAAVLTPIASGFLLLYALTGRQLSPTLAVALTVFANVVVMLLLIHRAGSKVARVAQDRQARAEARVAQVRKEGMRDALTGLLNRRGWDEAVAAGEKRCRAELCEACVVVVDLDGLKRVNDSEGHKAGDVYIHRASHALKRAARRGDALARLGGDEFGCLVVNCDEAMAQAVVARFEEALRDSRVSASVGYAMRGRRSLAAAFEEADRAMYEQKRARKLRRA